MARRFARLAVLLAVLTSGSSWASAVTVRNEPHGSGVPGAYVTLPFQLEGAGTFDYRVEAPEPWAPLAGRGSVRLEGRGYMSVTFRVPWLRAGTVADVVVVFVERGGAEATRAHGTVEVLASAGIELIGGGSYEAVLGAPFGVTVVVTNSGNVPDRIALHAEHPMWAVRLSRTEVALEPGESASVDVELEALGEVSSGYRVLLALEATSQHDPDLHRVSFVEVRFLDAATMRRETEPDAPPRLTLAVRTGVRGGLTIEDGAMEPTLDYDVTPRLAGELSDFVDMHASFGSFAGTLEDPFGQQPSQLDVGLTGERWDASARVGPGAYGVTAGGLVGDWRVSGGADLTRTPSGRVFGVTVLAASQLPELDLQLSGRTRATAAGRSDALGAWYRKALTEGVVLGVGADLSGTANAGDYRIDLGLHESVSYQTQAFDVTQSYSGVPFAGLHTVGLAGGLRATSPFGVRASTSLQVAPDTTTWRSSVTVDAPLGPAVRASLTGTYETSAAAAGGGEVAFGVRPGVAFRFGTRSLRAGFAVGYLYDGVLRGDRASRSTVTASGVAYGSGFSVSLAAAYEHLHVAPGTALPDDGSDEPSRSLEVEASARYDLSRSASLGLAVEYAWERPRDPDAPVSEDTSITAAWTQRWTPAAASRLAYERSVHVGAGATRREETASFAVEITDPGLSGLSITGAYAVTSDSGLFTGVSPLRHQAVVRVGYAFALPFDTPEPIVNLFGGRRGGSVRGTAFLDRDLDGRHDEDEPVIAGLALRLGGEDALTDADGAYLVRVPTGTYRWVFLGGAPASTEAAVAPFLEVTEDSRQVVDLPFVPVVSLAVTLFDDVDGDGQRSAVEAGIPFGGVLVEGAVARAVRVDIRGDAVVTGLVPGTYVVRVDPNALPARYRATTEPVHVVVREGERPAPVTLGAGAPPPEVVTTFTGTSLVMIARVDPPQAPAGAEVSVQALVTGAANDVVVEVGDTRVAMAANGSRYTAVVRLPRSLPLGPATLRLRAVGPAGEVEETVTVDVVDLPLASFDAVRVVPGRDYDLAVSTRFRATSVRVRIGADLAEFASDDGYQWHGAWRADAAIAGAVEAAIVVDGEELARETFEVPSAE